MAGADHTIMRQTIAADAADAGVARALQPKLADINERLFLPAIEQVFDEFDRAASGILIDSLTVDLGTVPLDGFATVAVGRLVDALRAELARRVAGTSSDSDPGTTTLSEDEAELAVLEHYLISGLWPAWVPRPAAYDFDRLLLGIAGAQPSELGAMLYRIGRTGGVLERLVAQLDESTLERLVEMLEPEHAVLIIGTVAESKLAHKAQPVTDLSEDAFADQVWLMTLNYLVAEPGTQFNRREFVKSLLLGMAEAAGAEYDEILSIMRRALRQVARRRPLRSSLPAILLELAREEGQAIDAAAASSGGQVDEADADDGRDARAPPSTVTEAAYEGGAWPRDRQAWQGHGRDDWDDIARILAQPSGRSTRPTPGVSTPAVEVDFARIEPLLADAEAVFRRYDAVDALARYIRDGRPGPRSRAIAGRHGESVSALLELPAPTVRALLLRAFATGGRRSGKPRLARFLAGVTRPAIERLLTALMPTAMTAGAPFLESVRTYAAEAADVAAFYAGLMHAVLKDEPIALDELSASVARAVTTRRTGRRTESAEVPAALRALLQAMPPAFRPREDRVAMIVRIGGGLPSRYRIDARSVAQLIRESLAGPVSPDGVEALRRSVDVLDRAKKLRARSRVLLRAAIEEIGRGTRHGIVAQRRTESAAVFAAVHALLQGLPPALRQHDDDMTAILRLRSSASEKRAVDIESIADIIRESLRGPVTLELVDMLRQHLDVLDQTSKFSARSRVVLRAAVAEIAGEFQQGSASKRGGESVAVLSALHQSLQAVPANLRLPEDRIAAILLAASDARRHRPVDVQTIARLIRECFAVPLSPAIIEALRRSLETPGGAAELGPRPRAMLRAVIDRLGKETAKHEAPRRRTSKAEQTRAALRDAALSFLTSGGRTHGGDIPVTDAALADATIDLIAREPARAVAAVHAGARRRRTVAAWSRRLPASVLARLTAMTEPRRHRTLIEIAESLGALLQGQLAAAGKPAYRRRDLWAFVLNFAAAHAGRPWPRRDLLAAFMRSEVSPRLGRPAVFEDMLHASASSTALPDIQHAKADDAGRDISALPGLLQAEAPEARQRALEILLDSLASRGRREAVGSALSSEQFAAALAVLEPRRHKLLLETGTLLFAALAATDRSAAAGHGDTPALRRLLLDFLAAYRGRSWSAETLVREFFRQAAARYAESLGSESAADAFLESLMAAIGARAETAGMTSLAQALRRLRPVIGPHSRRGGGGRQDAKATLADLPPTAAEPRPAVPFRRHGMTDEKAARAPIYIDNAGLVLAAPFIPHLFRELGMLAQTTGGSLKLAEHNTATRAVHLLQYLVTARTATPEPLLVLNKILAGIPIAAVVGARIDAAEEELALCAKVLASMLANWPALSTGTSIAGLQNSFMQREGRLTFDGDRWRLKVERKTLDVLVDRIPWSFRLIYHSWMPQPLHVEW